jgi:ubiquinone biosynthesis protein
MAIRRPTGFVSRVRNLERVRQIAEVAVRHGFGYFFERHNLWDLVPLRRGNVEPIPEQRGKHVREMLEELGPTFVKFGQLLSTRPDVVPADVIEELVKLQDRVAPIPFETVRGVVESELGLTLERLFETFDPEPVAAASIGQVHRATLPGGDAAMVKVQRPTARRQIERDIELLYQLAEFIRDRVGAQLFVDPVRLVDEFASSITQEVDYVLEGRHATRFAEQFEGSDSVVIPRVHRAYSTRRVLTMDAVDGPTVNSLDLQTMSLDDRRVLAETITRTWFQQILSHGFFHADPHPGNIVVLSPRRIGLLDFGMAGSLTPDDLENGTGLFTAIIDRDLSAVMRHLHHLGLRWPVEDDDSVDEALELVFSRYYGATLRQVDPSAVLHEVFDLVYSLHLRLPTRFLMLEKALVTLEGVVGEVYGELDIFALARPYARALLVSRMRPDAVAERVRRYLENNVEMVREFPRQLHDILDEARSGELKVKFVHSGLDNLAHKLDLLTNRVVVAVVVAALAVAGAIMAAFIPSGPRLLGISIWGLPGFAVALVFGIWLMWAIMRSGRL